MGTFVKIVCHISLRFKNNIYALLRCAAQTEFRFWFINSHVYADVKGGQMAGIERGEGGAAGRDRPALRAIKSSGLIYEQLKHFCHVNAAIAAI